MISGGLQAAMQPDVVSCSSLIRFLDMATWEGLNYGSSDWDFLWTKQIITMEQNDLLNLENTSR